MRQTPDSFARAATALLTATVLLCPRPLAASEPVGDNNSFEQVSGTLPEGWKINESFARSRDALKVETGKARSGEVCLHALTSEGNRAELYQQPMTAAKPGDVFAATLFVKGTGRVAVSLYAYDAAGVYLETLPSKTLNVDFADWEQIHFEQVVPATVYPPKDRRGTGAIAGIRPVIQVSGENDLFLDDAGFTLERN